MWRNMFIFMHMALISMKVKKDGNCFASYSKFVINRDYILGTKKARWLTAFYAFICISLLFVSYCIVY